MVRFDVGKIFDSFSGVVCLAIPLVIFYGESRINVNRDPSSLSDKSLLRAEAESAISYLPDKIRLPVSSWAYENIFDHSAERQNDAEVYMPAQDIMDAFYGQVGITGDPLYCYLQDNRMIDGEAVCITEAYKMNGCIPESTISFCLEMFFERDAAAFGPAHVYRVRATDLKRKKVILDREVADIEKELIEILNDISPE